MSAMSELSAELSDLKSAKDEAFGWYNHLLATYPVLRRTVQQDHEICMAQQAAWAARVALDNYENWNRK